MQIETLEPMSFPLHGLRLIEASAGTGKTFTITALYLRLLLEQNVREQPLGVEQILVVTFTEAATEELRDRIRSRIQQARQAFIQGQTKDPVLSALLDEVSDHTRAAELMALAAQSMDQAAIFTIHGFAQRMLRQHAFESGSLFDNELETDDAPLIRQAVLDFWRQTLYPLDEELALAVLEVCASPDELIRAVRSQLNTPDLILMPDLRGHSLEVEWQGYLDRVNAFRTAWQADRDDLIQALSDAPLNGNKYRNRPKLIETLDAFACGGNPLPDKDTLNAIERFTPERLESGVKQGGQPPVHPAFGKLAEVLEHPPQLWGILLSQAFAGVKQRLEQIKQQRQLMCFDDLLTGLDTALASASGARLAEAIRHQFPVALIDEFQDTDPLQYRSFSRIYAGHAEAGLFMIGDPKQAIYAFRGADIFTYMQARRAVDALYTMDKNWRSSTAMVESVNRVFMNSDSPFMQGDEIPFIEVKAADKADKTPLLKAGQPLPALTFWQGQTPAQKNKNGTAKAISAADHRAPFAEVSARRIAELLQADTRIGDEPLATGDIAVLVRDRYEADAIGKALRKYQLPFVYLSNRDSVFSTQEAADLERILLAVLEPHRERLLRAALASPLLGLTAHTLEALNRDEQAWEVCVSEFEGYREVCLKQGVLPMVRQLIRQRELGERLLGETGGERRLTDLLHLAELLQSERAEHEGMPGLMRWFAECRLNPNGNQDSQQVRLESDYKRITVITIHKSKGLEYPLVFLPFAGLYKGAKEAFYHDDERRPVLDLSGEELEAADQERLAEDLRLLYVALTRAVYACYVGVMPYNDLPMKGSALGYLLGDPAENWPALENLAAQHAAISVEALEPLLDAAEPPLWQPPQQQLSQAQARDFNGQIRRDWRISSYSALSRHHGSELSDLPQLDLEVAGEAAAANEEDALNIFTFPRGAHAGTLLHEIFERIDFPSAGGEELEAVIAERLQLAGFAEHWLPVLVQMVHDVLDTPLSENGERLRDISTDNRKVELEFMLAVEQLEPNALNRLLAAHDPLSAQASGLWFEQLHGMLKGFVDLIFRVDGRYYILDYKSNHLGMQAEDYSRESLERAMIEHRYDFQYQIYTLALHRWLRERLPDYDYDRDIGGVFYLFLRGMQPGSSNGVFHCKPERELIEKLDAMFSQHTEVA